MTTSKPQAAVDSKALGATKPAVIASVAWDPYEVWRTRVLVPARQEAAKTKQEMKPAA
jgi:hypothetical protein